MTGSSSNRQVWALAVTTFGLGHMRPASGTWGSLPPPIIAGALLMAGASHGVVTGVMVALAIVFSLACLLWGDRAEARWNKKDPGQVVADETAGQALALLAIPGGADDPVRLALVLLTAFLAFRVLDIIKPWPAGKLQSIRGGAGILIDDLIAGLEALVIVQVLWRWVF
ncbi:MAG: phosphatidylglycerophosphatase A [Planctomycetota bacterium]